jgi:cytochrome c
MKSACHPVAALSLAMLLAACGSGTGDDAASGGPADTAVPEVAASGTATPENAGDDAILTGDAAPSATPTAAASASAAATPAPGATASAKPAPAAAAAAVAKPPAFAMCGACHAIEAGKNGIGPSLAGVFGARAGHVSSFEYSDAMKGSGLKWDEATLHRYLENPRVVVPGTNMSYAGLKDQAKRQQVIDYLKSL